VPDDETWVRETLDRAGWPVDEEALPWIVLVHGGIRRQLQVIADDPTLAAVVPEVDLDPSRAPRSRSVEEQA
jgi:hypothetical protein